VRAASPPERRRLNELFAELCAIPSPFGHEAGCGARVRAELQSLGLAVTEDGAAEAAGGECGNLLARIPGRSERSILLCAHLDTVPHEGAIEPVIVDDAWQNARPAILGADNKAAIAVMLALARRCAVEGSPVGIELLFTVCEENALAGAKAFDVSGLRSDFGFVFDHATPIGEVIVASPTYYRVEAALRGRAAHAGIRPEDGRSAIVAAARAIASLELGRLDAETTANVGLISGGSGVNVVPEHARFTAEVRSIDADRAAAVVAQTVDRIHEAANDATCDVDADVTVERLFDGYRRAPTAPSLLAAEAALRACAHEPRRVVTGGGSDANAFATAGFECTNLANGTENAHEPTERVAVAALEQMLDVALALLDASAAQLAPAPAPPA
jgi:tripeptide aminopeptidase